jgi:hypothetical protein
MISPTLLFWIARPSKRRATILPVHVFGARSAAGHPAKKTDGLVTADMSGILRHRRNLPSLSSPVDRHAVRLVQPMVAAFGLVCIRSCGNIRLEVSNFKRHVRVFPSRLEFSSHFFHVGAFLLDFQSLENPKQRPRVATVVLQIGTKHSSRSIRFAV